jgi:hypothetical protein
MRRSSTRRGWFGTLVGQLHMSAEQIEGLSEEEAIELVHKHWSRERR